MKEMKELKRKLMDELKEYSGKAGMRGGDLETIWKLTDTIKNIDKICMLEEGEYSMDGYSNTGGGYSRGGRWEAGGEYGMDDYSGRRRRDSMGRYTRDGGDMREHMMRMVNQMRDPEDKEAMRRFLDNM